MDAEHKTWAAVLSRYAWDVDLGHYKYSGNHPGHFDRVIDARLVTDFEDAFRRAVDSGGSYVVAGEVCYWKNYGSYQSRDRVTERLLRRLSSENRWKRFGATVGKVCADPTFQAFIELQEACGQSRGFATPITFMAFYAPTDYPMVDKHIADWWRQWRASFGHSTSPDFSQRPDDGWIETTSRRKTQANWEAYLAWTRFCREYASRLPDWRARDAEMTVWTAQKRGLELPSLPRSDRPRVP